METDLQELNGWLGKLTEMVVEYAPKVALAVILLVIGLKIINKIADMASQGLKRAGISESLLPFLGSVVGISLKVLLFFSIAGIVGIDTASFVAVLAAASFAVGLALQGSLSNFAAGIIILIFRPYHVDEWIEVDEKFGKVEEIQIFNTILITPGKKTLIIPNGQIIDNIVTNYSRKGQVRLELAVTMPYEESFPKIQDIILNVLNKTPGVLSDPAAEVGIEAFDSHSIILSVRPYVHPDDYWPVTFDINARIKAAFYEHKIKVAYSEGVEMGQIGE